MEWAGWPEPDNRETIEEAGDAPFVLFGSAEMPRRVFAIGIPSAGNLDEFLGTNDTDVVSCGRTSLTGAAVAHHGGARSPGTEAS